MTDPGEKEPTRGRHDDLTRFQPVESEAAETQHQRIDRALAEVSAHFVQAAEPDFDEVLSVLGRAVGASRAYVFRVRDDGRTLDNTHEWCAPAVESALPNLQGLDVELYPWWMDSLKRGETIRIEDVAEMPDEASAEREAIEAQSIRSLLVVPIRARTGALEGFLGFDDTQQARQWKASDTRALKVVAEIIGTEIERRRATDALRRSEERFRQLAENIPQVFWMTSLDKDTMVYVSRTYEAVWARSVESLMDNPRNWLEAIHPEDRDRVAAALPGQPEGTYDEEYRVVRPDGTIRWVRDRAFPVRDENGRIYRVAGVAEDVTDRKRHEEELGLLASAIEHAGEGVIITDAAGRIEYVNPAVEEITGYARSDLLGKNPRILKSGKQDAEFYRRMWDTLLGGHAWHARFINRRKDGTLYPQDSVITPVHASDGEITHLVAVFRDVTNEVALEEQLRQSQKLEAVGRLAGGIAHDFNNVLTIVTGRTQFALDDLADGDPLAAELREVLDATERAQRLSRQLLAFSRQQVTRPEVLDVGEVIGSAQAMLRRLLGEDLTLSVSLSPDLGRVKADRTQMEQVLFNLAINARDAMPDGGTLRLEVDNIRLEDGAPSGSVDAVQAGEYIRVCVSDTGTGMDEETRSHLFEPFYTTKPRDLGTGLGLSTVYGIVRQSGGTIRVESEPDVGTTFEIYLPRTDEVLQQVPRLALEEDPEEDEQDGTGTVLVVEDQAGVRSMVCRSLERVGYRVLEAKHGREALEVCGRESGIDLVATDLVMPEMGGRELAERVRAEYPTIRVLFMSGYAHPDDAPPTADDYEAHLLEKPFGPREIQRKVGRLLSSEPE